MTSRMHVNFSFQSKSKAVKQAHVNDSLIRDLMKLPHNRKCINCNSPAPQYVCTTFSTFVCLTCSGIHREFSHRVKSVLMANFTPEEVAALQAGGNQRAKEVYLSRWNSQQRSATNRSDVGMLRDFIKHTYVERRYADNPDNNFHNSSALQKSDDGSRNSRSYSFKDGYFGYGEDPSRISIDRGNNISYEVVSDTLLHDEQQLKSTNDDRSTIKETQIEQKLLRHLEELESVSKQLREVIQPYESSSSEASPSQEAVFSSKPGSDSNGQTEYNKDTVEVVTESKTETEPHISGSIPTSQSASSTGETSFSKKFQAVVLKMMEHKKGCHAGSELNIPEGIQNMQTCQSNGEQTMTTSSNWAPFDPPFQGKMCPSLNWSNLESYLPVSADQGMSDSKPMNLDSLASSVLTNWGISDHSNRQPSNTSGSAPDLMHDMLHGVPSYQLLTSSTASTNRKKEVTNSEALFAATFLSFPRSQAPSSCENGERIPPVLEKQICMQTLKSRNPFDVSNEPTTFQGTMPTQDEQANRSCSTRLLHSSSTLSTSSQFFQSPSSPHRVMPSDGPFYAEMPSTCTNTLPPPCTPLSLGFIGHASNANDGYWQTNSPFHHRLPAMSKSFSPRGNPFA